MERVTRFDVDGGIAGSLDVDGSSRNRTQEAKDDMTTHNDANDQKRFERAVNERAELIATARTVLPENFKFDLLTTRQIREAALKAMHVTFDFSGKADDYVHGYFDTALADLERQRGANAASQRSDSKSGTRLSRAEAQARLDERERRLGTPAHLQPLAYTKDARADEKLESWEQPLEVGRNANGDTHGVGDDE